MGSGSGKHSAYVDERLVTLRKIDEAAAWRMAKPAMVASFEAYMSRVLVKPYHALMGTATPEDVLCFLIEREETGRTRVHTNQCPQRGSGQAHKVRCTCDCPKRKAHKTLNNELSLLKLGLEELGMKGEFGAGRTRAEGQGNPADHPLPRRMVAAVGLEQATAGGEQQQAEPLYREMALSMVRRLRVRAAQAAGMLEEAEEKGGGTGTDGNRAWVVETYKWLRNAAFMEVTRQHWDRAADLGSARWSKLAAGLLKLTKTKTLRAPAHGVRVMALAEEGEEGWELGEDLRRLQVWGERYPEYIPQTDLMFLGIDEGERRHGGSGKAKVLEEGVTTKEMCAQLQRGLGDIGVSKAEIYTCKSLRMGGAITAFREGNSWERVAEHGFWKTKAVVQHYAQAADFANAEERARTLKGGTQ